MCYRSEMLRPIFFYILLSLTWATWAGSPLAPTTQSGVPPLLPITPKATEQRIDSIGSLAWLKDENGILTLDEVRTQGDFRPLQTNLSAGFTRAAIWLRFDIQATNQAPREWILEIANALLDDVRLYTANEDGVYIERRSGEDLPRSGWEVDYRNPSFRLHLDGTKNQRFYLRLWARNAISTPILLWQPTAFAAATRYEAFNYGFFFGVYGLILVFQLFFWAWTRERFGGWYVLYVALNCGAAAITAGYLQILTGALGTLSDMILGLILCITVGASNTFVVGQLELADAMPRFTRIYLPVMWIITIVTSLLVLSGNFGLGVGVTQTVILICIAIQVPISIRLALNGHRPARLFLFAFGIFYAAVVLRFLRNLGVLPPHLLTEHLIPMGSILHMVILSLVITGKYNQIKREKLMAQAALNESLETQVAERTATLSEEISRRKMLAEELHRALEVEQQARQEQYGFVAMVSHEFRTPLAIINTVTQQINNNLNAPHDKLQQRCITIRSSVKRLTDMIDKFLSYDRICGELQMNRSDCDLRQLIASISDEWQSDRLQASCNNLPPNFVCDAELLRVALRNLIANAMRHSPETIPVQLTALGAENGSIEISVVDQGSGIDKDELPKIFHKYFRGRSAQTHPGAGLGLHLVERIAKLHGGSIHAESTIEQGSRFVLNLP